jgi:hypothetical protein
MTIRIVQDCGQLKTRHLPLYTTSMAQHCRGCTAPLLPGRRSEIGEMWSRTINRPEGARRKNKRHRMLRGQEVFGSSSIEDIGSRMVRGKINYSNRFKY